MCNIAEHTKIGDKINTNPLNLTSRHTLLFKVTFFLIKPKFPPLPMRATPQQLT